MDFIPGARPASDLKDNDYWFIVENSRLLIKAECGEEPEVPME